MVKISVETHRTRFSFPTFFSPIRRPPAYPCDLTELISERVTRSLSLPRVYRPVYTNNLQIAYTGRAWPPEWPVQSDGRSMPPRQTNRISSKRPYLYVVGIICPPRSRFWLLYIYTYKRDTRVFPLRGFFSKFSIVSQSSLSKFCTRHEALWKVSTRIFRAKIVPIKLSLILAIRFALPKGKRKILDSNSSRNRGSIAHFGMQRLTYEWTGIRSLRTRYFAILNINYLGDRVEADSFTRATRVIAPSRLYTCIHISVLKFSQSSVALGRGNGNVRAYICS